jgi:hypothetical protein
MGSRPISSFLISSQLIIIIKNQILVVEVQPAANLAAE